MSYESLTTGGGGGGGNDSRLHIQDTQPATGDTTKGDLWSKTLTASEELLRATSTTTFVTVEGGGAHAGNHIEGGSDTLLGEGAIELDAIKFAAATELTISSGSITVTQSYHTVDTEADAATDELTDIAGGAEGDLLVLQQADNGRDITIKDNSGTGTANVRLRGAIDLNMKSLTTKLFFIHNGSAWHELSRSGTSIDQHAASSFEIKDNTDQTKIIAFIASSIATTTTRSLTVPDSDLIIVGTVTVQTLTNKTLTTPTISDTGFTNAQHAHAAANSGGQLNTSAINAGTLVHERGGLESDVSAHDGLVAIAGGATAEVNSKSELEAQIDDVADFAEADGDIYTGVHDFGGAGSLEVPNGAGGTTVDATGEVTIDSTAKGNVGHLQFYDGSAERVIPVEISKSITIEDPTTAADITLFRENKAITIQEMVIVTVGSATPSITVDIRHHTDRNNAGNALITTPTASTAAANSATTTGHVITSFNDPTIPADSFIWIEIDAKSGTVDEVSVTIFYTIDA